MKARHKAVGLLLALALVAASCGDDGDDASADTDGSGGDKPGVAMILPGPISDADYNAVAYEALETTGDELDVETAYTDSVSVADAERVAADYAESGFEVVILHGAQFGTAVATLAPRYPDTDFVIQSSGEQEGLQDNVYNLARTYVPGFYLLGRLAASTSTTGTIAFLGGLDLPDFKGGANAVYEGALSVDPDIRMHVSFTGDQNDPVRGGQAAQALIGTGADVLVIALNNGLSGAVESVLANESPVLFTSLHTDKESLAPANFLASMEFNYAEFYPQVVQGLLDGDEERFSLMEPQNAGVQFSDVYNVDPAIAEQFDTDVASVADGNLEVPEVNSQAVEVPSS